MGPGSPDSWGLSQFLERRGEVGLGGQWGHLPWEQGGLELGGLGAWTPGSPHSSSREVGSGEGGALGAWVPWGGRIGAVMTFPAEVSLFPV